MYDANLFDDRMEHPIDFIEDKTFIDNLKRVQRTKRVSISALSLLTVVEIDRFDFVQNYLAVNLDLCADIGPLKQDIESAFCIALSSNVYNKEISLFLFKLCVANRFTTNTGQRGDILLRFAIEEGEESIVNYLLGSNVVDLTLM